MRKLAREICFELIFEMLTRDEDIVNELSYATLCENENILEEQDRNYINQITETFAQNKKEILERIFSKITSFERDRVYKVDLALIALAVTEIVYVKQTDLKIVINEICELAKKYSTEKSHKFVNGVVSAIIKE